MMQKICVYIFVFLICFQCCGQDPTFSACGSFTVFGADHLPEVTENSQDRLARMSNEFHQAMVQHSLQATVYIHVQTKKSAQELQAEQELQQQKVTEFQKSYGTYPEFLHGSDTCNGLLSGSFEQIESWIVQSQRLDKQQALNIWDLYCSRRSDFLTRKKVDGRSRIEQEYDKRAQDTVRLQVVHESLDEQDVIESCYVAKRQQALRSTEQDGYRQHVMPHHLNEQVKGMLQARGQDVDQLESLSGTIFQHQLYAEVAQTYKKVAEIVFQHNFKRSLLADQILNLAESSLFANQAELVGLSLQLNNVCEVLAETSLSVCKGAVQAGCDFVDMVAHPWRSTERFVHSMASIITTLGGAIALCDNQSSLSVYHPQASAAVAQAQIEMGTELCQLARQEFAQKSGQEKIQAVSKFVVDSILYAKAIKLVGRSVAGLMKSAKDLRLVAGVGPMIEEVGVFEAFEDLLEFERMTTPQVRPATVGSKLQEQYFSLIDAEIAAGSKAVGAASSQLRPLCELLDIVKLKGAYNSKIQKDLKKYFNEIFYKQELLENCKQAQKLSESMKVLYKGENRDLVCNVGHIATYDLGFRVNDKTGLREGIVSGGHVGIYAKLLEDAGHIKVLSEEILPGGVRFVKYVTPFGGKEMNKTYFSLSWSVEKIMQAIKEAFECCHGETVLQNGLKVRKGFSKDSVEIIIIFKQLESGKIKIITAYPYYKKIVKFI